ncbi:E3 ubiquitin-protein ligase Topors-like [Anopheles cruzii]|uniref:E3 ubiquitin-protein ligase Topors-like n=1 Tax=Anopheles cruzii TaxID=68878 RepID=UPI0022EC6EC7|nr:E3 ubiquitin-protein ligase Topors-like [Anopheles cruzii]
MEEVVAVAVDCPPTPEILPLTTTPPPPSQLQVVYSSSSEEADESADGRSSPPPKCAICLGKCRQKAYANSCRHQFCFRCLLEWSKVKPECPLCKQRFNSIVHYKSINCYEEHMIQTSNPLEQSLPREADFYRRLNFYVSDLPRITYHATLHMPTSQSELMQQLFMHQSSDVRRFIREFGDQVVPTRQNSIAWRQFIYRQRLYARPLPDVNGRFRVSSAHFYLMHPAQLHRILPWVEREVYAMETIAPTMSPPMATRMGYLLNSFDIDSPDFLRALAPYVCSSFREHFRHELSNFARSPYDMIGYDQCVQYEPRFNHRPNQHVILSSSDEELDSEQVDDGAVNMSEPVASTSSSSSSNSTGTGQGSTSGTGGRGRAGRTQFRFEARSTNETVIMTGTLRETRAEVEAFHAAASTPVIELNDNSDSPGSVSVSAAAATTTTSTLRDGDNISLSSSDSDDCQFVLAQKPPHLRTPDHVVDLESDYDSDVVFVAVESAGNQPATTNGDASEKHSLPLPKSDLSCEYNNGASTSSGYHGGAGSSGSGTSMRDNHYTRSRVNRYTGGMGVKSIYEESDSDEDEDDNEDGELYTASPRSPASGSSVCSSNSSSCPNTVCTVTSHDKVVYNLRTSVTTVTRGRKRKRNSRKTKQSGTKKVWRTRQRSTSSSSSSTSSSSDGDGSSSRKNVSTGSSNSSDSTRSSSATSSSSSSTSITSITSASASSASSESHSVEPSVVVKTSGDGHRIRLSTNWVTSKNKKNGKKDSKAEAASRAKPKTTRRGNAKKKGAQSKAARPPKAAPKKASAAKSNTEQPSGRSKRGKLSQKRPEEQNASPAVPMETGSSQEKGVKKIGQYFVQIQPSSSPTTEIASDDDTNTPGGGRKRKLSRVIIKRYHQDDQPGPQTKETDTSAPPGPECSSAKRTKSEDPIASCAPNGTTVEPTPGCSRNTVIAKTELIDAPSASGSDSDSDATAVGTWQDTASGTAASVIVSTSQLAQPTVSDSAAELQLPLMPDHEQLLEDANSVALDTLLRFSPTLHWASADPPPIEDHLSISVSDTLSPETFSTITFSPSSTSVSPLAAMLAIPSSSVPELIDGIGSLASASQLPSSVVGAATIDGAIDELMSIIPADAFNNTQASLTGDGPAGGIEATESSSGALSSCAPLPPEHEPTNLPGVQSIVAGSEVEL